MEMIFAIRRLSYTSCSPALWWPHNLRLPLDGIHTDQARFKNISERFDGWRKTRR